MDPNCSILFQLFYKKWNWGTLYAFPYMHLAQILKCTLQLSCVACWFYWLEVSPMGYSLKRFPTFSEKKRNNKYDLLSWYKLSYLDNWCTWIYGYEEYIWYLNLPTRNRNCAWCMGRPGSSVPYSIWTDSKNLHYFDAFEVWKIVMQVGI